VRSAELCGVGVEQCDFNFSRYQLMVYRSDAGIVGVLVEAPVSRRALSMAARIALAELPRLVSSFDAAASQDTSSRELPRTALPLDRFGPIASITPPE
jgi:hypothetical protein